MADPVSPSLADPASSLHARYGLEELLALASERLEEEITSRTVRLYATEGLIDRPGKDGRHAVYGQRHLLQLLLIRTLARRGLSLTAIAPLVVCSDQELAQQLLQLEQPSDREPSTGPMEVPSAEQQEALAYLQSLGGSGSQASAKEPPSSLLPLLGSPPGSSSRPETSHRSLSIRSAGRSNTASSRWYRVSLAPGVELHLSESVSIPPSGSRREAWLARLLARLREQLDHQQ